MGPPSNITEGQACPAVIVCSCVQDVDMLILPPTYDKRVPGLLLDLLLADLRAKARLAHLVKLAWPN